MSRASCASHHRCQTIGSFGDSAGFTIVRNAARRIAAGRYVATEACRRAANCQAFLARVRDEIGIEIEIISSSEEARLVVSGCAPLLNPRIPFEVQFDEHKLLIVYGKNLSEFESVFKGFSVDRNEEIKFITEAEHVHSSSEEYFEQFQQLRYRLGIDE